MKSALLITALAGIVGAQPTLKDAYKNAFRIGTALNTAQFSEEDKRALPIIKAQFNTITPENILKWMYVHPEANRYSFDLPDRYVAFGQKHGMFIIGHTLVWHSQVPRWVFEDAEGKPLTRDALIERMHDHIRTVVGRYKGRIKGWDVVNEALNEDGTLRQSPWMKIIGPDYLAMAFRFAHEADPDAQLYYNDYSLENPAKREGAVKLIRDLKQQGVPVYGVGLQGHNKLEWPSVEQQDETIRAFKALGVKVMITELDIDVLPSASGNRSADVGRSEEALAKFNPYTKGLPEDVERTLARRYAELFGVYWKHRDVVERVTFWGVTNADSWLNNWPVRGRTNYPLLFDRDGKPTPAYAAVIAAAKAKP